MSLDQLCAMVQPNIGLPLNWILKLASALISLLKAQRGTRSSIYAFISIDASFHFPFFFFYSFLFSFFSLPYLSSIHEKSNFIAIFWTGRPHLLGSCHFQGVWAIYLPHKSGGVPLNALFKDTTSELAGLFSTTSSKCRASSREAVDTIF